jgi:short-subunit dehydrogenase
MKREPIHLTSTYGKGTTAVITGATNDLGREFAETLHKKGFSLILVDEDAAKVN